MQIIKDLNTFFRTDKTIGIYNVMILINNYSKGEDIFFKLPRRFQIKGTNENTRRKIYNLLTEYNLVERKRDKVGEVCQNENTGIFFKKKYYRYKITPKFFKILQKLIKGLLHKAWVVVKQFNTITEIKTLIKKIYKNTTFNVDKYKNHIFTFKGKRCSLNKYRDGIVYVKYEGIIQEWVQFYYLNIKKRV